MREQMAQLNQEIVLFFWFFTESCKAIVLYYFQIRMRPDAREFFVLANERETQRSSATLNGMSRRQSGKGASRWRG